MDIHKSTKLFEQWLSGHVAIVRGDLRHKHAAMGESRLSFLRATYYRWAQQFADLPSETAKAPMVLSVGDLHLENFGTWRDGLGRLAWGINDFDEAFPLPYTHDLVRLAASALLAIDQDHLDLKGKDACRAIVDGYREGIETGGRPFVIGEDHRWFKPILNNPQRDPGLFWDKLRGLPRERASLPVAAGDFIRELMPDPDHIFEVRHRVAGLGNLGKPRYTAIMDWHGGPVAREVKALTPSAAAWAGSTSDGPYYGKILAGVIRSSDPFLKVHGSWVGRRLSPDCRRLEVGSLTRVDDEEWLLHAMGFETANVHLGTIEARKRIAKHLADYPGNGIRKAAEEMIELLDEDFKSWHRPG